jgi:hypothetical protein
VAIEKNHTEAVSSGRESPMEESSTSSAIHSGEKAKNVEPKFTETKDKTDDETSKADIPAAENTRSPKIAAISKQNQFVSIEPYSGNPDGFSSSPFESGSPEELTRMLKELIASGLQSEIENEQEQRSFESRYKRLKATLDKMLGLSSMAIYTEVMKGTGQNIPTPYVLAYQTQLCRAFHVNEIYSTQIKKSQKKNKKLISFLNSKIVELQHETTEREKILDMKLRKKNNQVMSMCKSLGIDPLRQRSLVNITSDTRTSWIPNTLSIFGGWSAS